MALCAQHGAGLLQNQRPLPCRRGTHCSVPACSSGGGASSAFSGGPAPSLCSSSRSGCDGAFVQHPQPGSMAFHTRRRCQRQVLCSAAGGDNSGNSASKVFAWAMDAARRTFRRKAGDAQQPQPPSGNPQASEGSGHQDPQQQQQRLGGGAAQAPLASQRRGRVVNSGSSAHDVADEHRQESFDCWKEYIGQMDEKIKASMEAEELLNQAVAEERYDDAARLRKQLEEIFQDDTVGVAMEEMEKALREERYEDAARLRDESYTGLVGWWAGRGEDDPYGHLLHISAGYSSYTGRAYLPRQLSEIREYVNSGQLSEEDMDSVLLGMGQPFMELFLRKDAETGRLRCCATAILPSEAAEGDSQDAQDAKGVVPVGDSSDHDNTVVQVHVQISPGVTLGPEVEGLSDSGSISDSSESTIPREVSEVLENLKDEVLRQLKASMEQQGGQDGDRDAFADIIDPTALLDAASGAGSDLSSGGGLGGIIKQLGGGGTFEMGADDGTTITVEVTQGGGGAQEFSRHAADLRRFGKDRFVIQILKDREVDPQDPEGSGGSSDAGDEEDELEAKVLADLTETNGEPADVSRRLTAPATKPTSGRRRPRLASDIRRQGRQGRLSLIQIADFDSPKPEEPQPEALRVRDAVAREVWRLQQAHAKGAGPAVDRATIISLIRKVARERRSAKRRAAAATSGRSHPSGGLASIDPAELFEGRVSYRRIPTGLPYTDPFSGTYLAAFGPHGCEMLLLTRAVGKGGHEIVTARKLTGDPNVPAGEISFTANIDRSARLNPSEYPEILGVTGRYAGKGLVAQPNFRDPKWVEGELLQFAEGSPVTQGARLGFMWAYPGRQRFLVLLHRVGLDEEDN